MSALQAHCRHTPTGTHASFNRRNWGLLFTAQNRAPSARHPASERQLKRHARPKGGREGRDVARLQRSQWEDEFGKWTSSWVCSRKGVVCHHRFVGSKRRSSRACIGNPKLAQETIEGTHAQETPAYQRRSTTLHEVQGSNPARFVKSYLRTQASSVPIGERRSSPVSPASYTSSPAKYVTKIRAMLRNA